MNKKIALRDYKGSKREFIITDFENVESIDITIISGDEIADIEYKDGRQLTNDSSNERLVDYYDDFYELPLEFIDEFSNFKGNGYKCRDYIKKLKKSMNKESESE